MHATLGNEGPICVGRYDLFDVLATGGMATVHLGRLKGAVGFSRMVAVKRLHSHLVKDHQFVAMFVDEARLAARIRHPNVVPIIDVVQTDHELFLVMDYVQGASLARAASLGRKNGVAIPLPVATSIVADVLRGLHAAHEARDDRGEPLNIVHRDVSPQNIMVGADGAARILDFGIAKARGRLQNTEEGVLKGKLAYMAPEQLGGAEVGREADLYAVGVILWELLAGRRLHAAPTEMQVLASVLQGVNDPPSKHRPDIPVELDRLVMKALASEPSARFATARAFAYALEEVMPIASAAHIAQWLEQVADEVLQTSAVMLASVDSRPRSFPDTPFGSKPGDTIQTEQALVSAASLSSRGPVALRNGAALLVAALLTAVITVAAMERNRWEAGHASASTTSSAPPAQQPATVVTASSEPAPPVPTTSARHESPAVSAAAVGVQPSRMVRRTHPAVPAPTATAAPAASKAQPSRNKVDCDPPYTIDNRGIQRLKPQCL